MPPPAPARAVARGEHGREVGGAERARLAAAAVGGGPPVAGEHPGGPFSGRIRLTAELRAEAGRGDRHRRARGGAAGIVQLGEVGGQGHIVERPAVEPGVEPPQRAGVGAPGVLADGGLDQAARGRRGPADRGLFGVDPDG